MKKFLGVLGIVAALGASAFAISTVLPAGAQTPASSPPASSDSSGPHDQGGGRAKAAKDALDGLVANGVINQSQEDAVIKALKDAVQQGGGRGPHFGHMRARIGAGMIKVAADKIGVTPKDLLGALRNGQSIADVANSKGVNPSDVVTAIVDAGNQRIDQAVSKGYLQQDRADALKAKLSQLADTLVNTKGLPGHGAHSDAGHGPDQSSSSSS